MFLSIAEKERGSDMTNVPEKKRLNFS